MSKRYYWLKLKEDFFRQRAIKKLRRIAGGDTYTIVYLKMLLLAMKDNGKIALDGADFSDELALELDEEPDNVKMTVSFLMHSGLMEEVNPNEVFIPAAIESVGSESTSAERVRRFRAKQNALGDKGKETKALPCNASNVSSNKNETTEIRDKRKENRDKRIESRDKRERVEAIDVTPADIVTETTETKKKRDSEEPLLTLSTPKANQLVEQFNYMCPSFKKIGKLTQKQKTAMASLLETHEGDLLVFKRAFFLFESNEFLKSHADDWATLDWLIKPENFEDVLKGRVKDYRKAKETRRKAPRTSQKALEDQLKAEGSFKGWDELKSAFGIDEENEGREA